MTPLEFNQMKDTVQNMFADELMDFKKVFDREFSSKTGAKDAMHTVIDKERSETPHCVECGSLHIVKNGKTKQGRQKYMCKDCGKSYSDTRGSITASSKKPYQVWEAFFACMILGLSLRQTAAMVDICKNTADNWRHKAMEAMKKYDMDEPLEGEIQMDETYFLLNMKGLRSLPRPSKNRKTKSYRRGLNIENIAVLTAIDEYDRIHIKPVGQGNPSAGKLLSALDGRIKEGSTIVTDSKPAYKSVAKYYGAKLNQIPSESHQDGIYNLGTVNELHSNMKTWFTKFKGVSSRHLSRYLAWFRFQKLINYRIEKENQKRFMMNRSIQEKVNCLIKTLRSTPFPIDISLPYS